mmetsp:Transcript_1479/g.3562  ORF Transcript_1479/g.3562 Transcript_1479/m.3562 type:complete len:230 (+) Transcript_1479:280-969(+)
MEWKPAMCSRCPAWCAQHTPTSPQATARSTPALLSAFCRSSSFSASLVALSTAFSAAALRRAVNPLAHTASAAAATTSSAVCADVGITRSIAAPVTRLTAAESTPGVPSSTRCTAAEHPPQFMPSTSSRATCAEAVCCSASLTCCCFCWEAGIWLPLALLAAEAATAADGCSDGCFCFEEEDAEECCVDDDDVCALTAMSARACTLLLLLLLLLLCVLLLAALVAVYLA